MIKVAASSINPSDIHPTISEGAGIPHVMGSDISGSVVAIEPHCAQTSKLKVGTRVWGDIGANTLAAKDGSKTKELGAYGQYAIALDTQLSRLPHNINFVEGAALPKVALTSYKAFTWYAGALNQSFHGRTVLVLGGSGGTGSTGIQIARALGAGKIITTTSAENGDYVRSLGANEVIDYHTSNWWEVLQHDSVDVVYDCVGQPGTGDRAMTLLRPGGYYVTITGALANHVKEGVQQHMFINSDTNLNSRSLLEALSILVENDQLRMRRIQEIFTLEQIPQAFKESESGHVVGKLVVNVTSRSGVSSNM